MPLSISHDGSMVLLYMVCHGSHQYTPLMDPQIITGWWMTYPVLKKWWSESQLGWWHSQIYGNIMFQTTNQIMLIWFSMIFHCKLSSYWSTLMAMEPSINPPDIISTIDKVQCVQPTQAYSCPHVPSTSQTKKNLPSPQSKHIPQETLL